MPGAWGRLLEWVTAGGVRRIGNRTYRATLSKQRARLIDRRAAAEHEATRARHALAIAEGKGDAAAIRDAKDRLRTAEGEARSLAKQIERKTRAIERAAAVLLAVSLSGCAATHDATKATAKTLIVVGEQGLSLCEAKEPAPPGCGSPECKRARMQCLRLPFELEEAQDIADALFHLYEAIGLWVETGHADGLADD